MLSTCSSPMRTSRREDVSPTPRNMLPRSIHMFIPNMVFSSRAHPSGTLSSTKALTPSTTAEGILGCALGFCFFGGERSSVFNRASSSPNASIDVPV